MAAGIDSVPVNTFSYYDHVLDTAVLVGALPPRVSGVVDDLDRYFAAARGNDEIAPLEMTKWFDTNYHYIVPEIGPDTRFALDPAKVLGEVEEARALGIPARPVIVGPITFLALSKAVDGAGAPIDRFAELVAVYGELLQMLADEGVEWVQLDEPVLVTDILENAADLAEQAYGLLGQAGQAPRAVRRDLLRRARPTRYLRLPALRSRRSASIWSPVAARRLRPCPNWPTSFSSAGIVDGRNIWRTDLEAALGTLATLLGSAKRLAVSTSCSTMHVPYTLEAEADIDAALRSWLAFGSEKVAEVVTLSRGLKDGREAIAARDRRIQCGDRIAAFRSAAATTGMCGPAFRR